MSNSSCCETVVADNGREETRWLMGSIAVILVFAALTLQFNQQHAAPVAQHLNLDVTGKATLTALRNAADEISFLTSGKTLPSLAELSEAGTPPFADEIGTFTGFQWQLLENRCYYGRSERDGAEFVLLMDEHTDVYWRAINPSLLTQCGPFAGWQSATNHD